MIGSKPTSEKTIERIRKMRAAGFGMRTIVKLCRVSTDTVVKVCGHLDPEERVRRAAIGRWPNGAKPKATRVPRVPRAKPPRVPRVPQPTGEIRQMEREPEITLTSEQRAYSRKLLRRLAGEGFEEPKTRLRFSDEMLDEQEQLSNYRCKGGASPEVISTALASVDWKAIRRATVNARAQLRAEVQRGLENAEARARYIRGEFGDSRLKPRAMALEVANAA